MAWTAHKDEESVKERFDEPHVLEQKIDSLVALIKKSKHFVIFTGAGVSTSAGIPDFRGPQGVWTLKAKNEKRTLPTTSTLKALPTVCHMAIVKLQKEGICKYLITQNCDGLHRRSGININKISELHGNGNVEECEKCEKQYFRDFKAYRLGRGHDHFTGRYCVVPGCGGRLLEWTIDFGQNLPEKGLNLGFENAKNADLHLVLGSSLTVSPACNMPERTRKQGGSLVICNLQHTPLDYIADIKIYATCDVVMKAVMEKLGLNIPQWKLRRRFVFEYTQSKGNFKINIKGIDIDDDKLPATIFKYIEFKQPFKKLLQEEPFEFAGQLTPSFNKFKFILHFMGHYGEPPLEIEEPILQTDMSVLKEYKLSYSPISQSWKSKILKNNVDMDVNTVVYPQKFPSFKTEKISENNAFAQLWSTPVVCTDNNGSQYVLVAGGSDKSSIGIRIFNLKTGGIEKITCDDPGIPFLTAPRWAHAACVVPEISTCNVYLIGGWDNKCQYNDVYLYNWETRTIKEITTTGYPPSYRGGLSATAWGHHIIVFGGANCSGGPYKYFNDVAILDCESREWKRVKYSGNPPSPRAQHSAVLINPHTLFVLGGYDGSQVLVDAHILNLNNSTWSKLELQGQIPVGITGIELPHFRVYPATFGLFYLPSSNKILAYGIGKSKSQDDPCVYLLDLESGYWTKLGSDFPSICCPTGCMVNPNEGVVLGGIDQDGEYSSNVFKILAY